MPFQFPKSNDNTWPLLQKYVANQYEFFTSAFPAMTFQSPSSSDTETNLIRKMLRNQATFYEAGGGGGGGGDTTIAPTCRVVRAADQSIPINTGTAIVWDTVAFQSASGMATVADSKVYALEAGIYAFSSLMPFEANGSGGRQGWVTKNGLEPRLSEISIATRTDGGQLIVGFSGLIDMQPGDYLETFVFQNSGGARNVVGSAATQAFFGMTRVSTFSIP